MDRTTLTTHAITLTLMAIALVAWVLFGAKECSVYPALIMTLIQGAWVCVIIKRK